MPAHTLTPAIVLDRVSFAWPDGSVALSATQALYLHRSGVKGYEDHAVGAVVDLATVAVR